MSFTTVCLQWPIYSGRAGNEWPPCALTNLSLSDIGETNNKDLINDRERVTSMLVANRIVISTLRDSRVRHAVTAST